MSDWRKVVVDEKEIKLFTALDGQFLWRTLGALQRESGMSEAEVIAALWKRADFVIEGKTDTGERVWALRERYWKANRSVLSMFTTSSTSSGF